MLKHISIDLGTKNTKIATQADGVVLNEPSVIAYDLKTGKTVAVGADANELLGKTPKDIRVVSPISGGVVADFDAASSMMMSFIKKCFQKGIVRPKAVLVTPDGATDVEKKVLLECVSRANIRAEYMLESSLSSAIGAGLSVNSASGNLLLDIGGGKTCAACVSFGGVVSQYSETFGGNDMDLAIIDYISKKYGVIIGKKTAEEIKIKAGEENDKTTCFFAMGRDEDTGLPKEVSLEKEEIKEALEEIYKDIVGVLKKALKETPPEMADDVFCHGIYLLGDASKLFGLDEYISQNVGIKTVFPENPSVAAVIGAVSVFDRSTKT